MQLLRVYLSLRQFDTAIETGSDYLLDEQGDKGVTYNNLGNAYFLKGDLTQAALYYKQAAELYPDDAGIQRNLARALEALGKSVSGGSAGGLDAVATGKAKSAAASLDVDSFYWIE